jgi:hypothetical protein|tara:strand:+ start:1005 stop:1319 length:315 start_codon:yes stop_codon:yes gene_type:complete
MNRTLEPYLCADGKTLGDGLYRELPQNLQDEIYNKYDQGDLIMINYPGHSHHKQICRVRTDGVDSDGDLRVVSIIKGEEDTEDEGDWFYCHHTRAIIIKKAQYG